MDDTATRHQENSSTTFVRLHATARADGHELAHISYRGSTGLEKFYERCGYVETGRVPGGLRFSFGDRDDVDMTYRPDGRPLL